MGWVDVAGEVGWVGVVGGGFDLGEAEAVGGGESAGAGASEDGGGVSFVVEDSGEEWGRGESVVHALAGRSSGLQAVGVGCLAGEQAGFMAHAGGQRGVHLGEDDRLGGEGGEVWLAGGGVWGDGRGGHFIGREHDDVHASVGAGCGWGDEVWGDKPAGEQDGADGGGSQGEAGASAAGAEPAGHFHDVDTGGGHTHHGRQESEKDEHEALAHGFGPCQEGAKIPGVVRFRS